MSEDNVPHVSGAGKGPWRRMLGEYRGVASVVTGLTLVQAGVASLSAFVPLVLVTRGENEFRVGLVAASYAGGFLFGALRATPAIRAIGHIRAFAGFAALATVLALALHGFPQLPAWMLIQAGIGLCVASLLTTGESWVAGAAPHERRGAVVAFYLVVSKVGQVAGPVALVALGLGASGAGVYMVVAAAFAASLIPICATSRAQPAAPSAHPFGVRELWQLAPGAVMGAFAAGAVNGSVLQLYALYAATVSRGSVEAAVAARGGVEAAAAFNAALAIGSLAAQWPAGWASDRHDRRRVIAWLAASAAVASLALAAFGHTLPWSATLLLTALWGAGSMSFYGIVVAHGVDRAEPGQATGVISGILVVWGVGAIVGPPVAGAAMASPLGASGLFVYAAVVLAALAAAMVRRQSGVAEAPVGEKSAFAAAPVTSVAAATLDPRADEDDGQLHLFHPVKTVTGDDAS